MQEELPKEICRPVQQPQGLKAKDLTEAHRLQALSRTLLRAQILDVQGRVPGRVRKVSLKREASSASLSFEEIAKRETIATTSIKWMLMVSLIRWDLSSHRDPNRAPTMVETPRIAPEDGDADHHPDPAVGIATRIETVAGFGQTPPLISRLFQGHLEGTGTDSCPQHHPQLAQLHMPHHTCCSTVSQFQLGVHKEAITIQFTSLATHAHEVLTHVGRLAARINLWPWVPPLLRALFFEIYKRSFLGRYEVAKEMA